MRSGFYVRVRYGLSFQNLVLGDQFVLDAAHDDVRPQNRIRDAIAHAERFSHMLKNAASPWFAEVPQVTRVVEGFEFSAGDPGQGPLDRGGSEKAKVVDFRQRARKQY